jgi:hypothetical protein
MTASAAVGCNALLRSRHNTAIVSIYCLASLVIASPIRRPPLIPATKSPASTVLTPKPSARVKNAIATTAVSTAPLRCVVIA